MSRAIYRRATLDPEPPLEARVIVNGEPVEGADPLFIGSLEDARLFVRELTPEERAEISIFTPGRIYRPDEL